MPLRRSGELEADRDAGADELVRHDVRAVQARNATSSGGDPALLEVGALRTRLMLASDVTQAYACVPLAHIVECRADKQVVLDDNFIPTVLHARTATRLARWKSILGTTGSVPLKDASASSEEASSANHR